MSQKVHVNPFGEVHPCRATVKPCRFGEAAHFASEEEARARLEAAQAPYQLPLPLQREGGTPTPPKGLRELQEEGQALEAFGKLLKRAAFQEGGARRAFLQQAREAHQRLGGSIPEALPEGEALALMQEDRLRWGLALRHARRQARQLEGFPEAPLTLRERTLRLAKWQASLRGAEREVHKATLSLREPALCRQHLEAASAALQGAGEGDLSQHLQEEKPNIWPFFDSLKQAQERVAQETHDLHGEGALRHY